MENSQTPTAHEGADPRESALDSAGTRSDQSDTESETEGSSENESGQMDNVEGSPKHLFETVVREHTTLLPYVHNVMSLASKLWLLDSHVAQQRYGGPKVGDIAVFRVPKANGTIANTDSLDVSMELVPCKVLRYVNFVHVYVVRVLDGVSTEGHSEGNSDMVTTLADAGIPEFLMGFNVAEFGREGIIPAKDFVRILRPCPAASDFSNQQARQVLPHHHEHHHPIGEEDMASASSAKPAEAADVRGDGQSTESCFESRAAETSSAVPTVDAGVRATVPVLNVADTENLATEDVSGSTTHESTPSCPTLLVGQRLIGTIFVPAVFGDSDVEEEEDMDLWVRL